MKNVWRFLTNFKILSWYMNFKEDHIILVSTIVIWRKIIIIRRAISLNLCVSFLVKLEESMVKLGNLTILLGLLSNFVAFSEYPNFIFNYVSSSKSLSLKPNWKELLEIRKSTWFLLIRCRQNMLKFTFFKKGTKIWQNLPLYLCMHYINIKSIGRFCHFFVAFLENLYFRRALWAFWPVLSRIRSIRQSTLCFDRKYLSIWRLSKWKWQKMSDQEGKNHFFCHITVAFMKTYETCLTQRFSCLWKIPDIGLEFHEVAD